MRITLFNKERTDACEYVALHSSAPIPATEHNHQIDRSYLPENRALNRHKMCSSDKRSTTKTKLSWPATPRLKRWVLTEPKLLDACFCGMPLPSTKHSRTTDDTQQNREMKRTAGKPAPGAPPNIGGKLSGRPPLHCRHTSLLCGQPKRLMGCDNAPLFWNAAPTFYFHFSLFMHTIEQSNDDRHLGAREREQTPKHPPHSNQLRT